MATTGTPLSFSDVLRLRPVRRLWIAQIVSVFGDFLAVFAIIRGGDVSTARYGDAGGHGAGIVYGAAGDR